ncbi:MAG: cytochrome c family protein [Reyranella sp.]|uniref:c-type cytochrome n=1 Tax=Reyranella sp. TaxID=1929291 RepID=UPI0027316BB3|nr:cytochrome c family protein [Reyranella sp.]MDP1963217.1 cytochrome c family protein [Reyranella sp.]MDP2374204.1 cytochrome c family protein [Reyranella sp.]
MKSWIGAAGVLIAGLSATAASAQSGDAARGQRVFNTQCRACHTLEKDGASTAGPNLHGVFGRKAGTGGGYDSSDAMKKSGIVWDDTTMAEYNRDPKGKVPGTKMLFNGVKNAGQLADLVAYLKEATK